MRDEITHEMEGRVEVTAKKARLVEEDFTGKKYWIPKSQTIDLNECNDEGLFLIVVTDWWWKKKDDFVAE